MISHFLELNVKCFWLLKYLHRSIFRCLHPFVYLHCRHTSIPHIILQINGIFNEFLQSNTRFLSPNPQEKCIKGKTAHSLHHLLPQRSQIISLSSFQSSTSFSFFPFPLGRRDATCIGNNFFLLSSFDWKVNPHRNWLWNLPPPSSPLQHLHSHQNTNHLSDNNW